MRELKASELKLVAAAGSNGGNGGTRQNQGNGSVNVLSFNNIGVNVLGIQAQNSGQSA
jgi:hypothetical protein